MFRRVQDRTKRKETRKIKVIVALSNKVKEREKQLEVFGGLREDIGT